MTAFPGLTAGTWTVDPTHAEVGFVARHLMVAKVRGRFTEVSGTVEVGETLAETS
ncbi:MAG TPA: YceI family protein, partial [Dermatophilaceae bacterium]|nr:YceI family protein [Dermatophilaceae bacterium]